VFLKQLVAAKFTRALGDYLSDRIQRNNCL